MSSVNPAPQVTGSGSPWRVCTWAGLGWDGVQAPPALLLSFPSPPTGPSSMGNGAQLPHMTCVNGWDEENCIEAKRKKMTAVCPCYFQGHSKSCLCCFNFWLVFLEAALLPLEKIAIAKMKYWATAAPVPELYPRSGWLAFAVLKALGFWGTTQVPWMLEVSLALFIVVWTTICLGLLSVLTPAPAILPTT